MMRRAISAVILMFLALACSGTSQFVPTSVDVFTVTLSSFASPTWTPLPTLSSDEAQALILDLLENNGECRLPCWWGITPGESTWEAARTFLKTFASEVSISGNSSLSYAEVLFFSLPEEISPAYLASNFTIGDGIVDEIETFGFSGASSYYLSQFLSVYGPPDEIWIDTWRKTLYPGRPFGLTLFYSEQGILASYSSLDAHASEGMIRGCLEQSPVLYLWDAKREVDFSGFAEAHGWDLKDPLHLPLEEATGMDIEMFYNTYKESGTAPCIETPYELWPEQ